MFKNNVAGADNDTVSKISRLSKLSRTKYEDKIKAYF